MTSGAPASVHAAVVTDTRRATRRVVYVALVGAGQAMAFFAGILLIRSMPKDDYAAYAAAVAAISAAGVIADSGIGATLIARMAAATGAEERFGVMRAALAARRRVSVLVLAVICSGLIVVFAGLHLTPLVIAASIVLVIAIVSNSLLRTLYTVDLQLQRRFVAIVGGDAAGSALRLALVAASTALALTAGFETVLFLGVFLVSSLLQTAVVRRFSEFRSSSGGDAAPHTAVFRAAFRATAPWTALMILGEQLINLLLTAYGNASSIAEISALTRYSLAFALVVSVIGNIAVGRLAQVGSEPHALRSAFRRVVAGGAVISLGYVGSMWVLRGPLLGLLGPVYAHLEGIFLVLAVASALQFFGTYVLGSVTHARGWLRGSWTFGPFLGLWLIAVVTVLQPRDSTGAAIAFLTLQIPTVLTQVIRVALGFRGTRQSAAA